MWPLFCNEVALSYDQEERIRSLQKEILSNQESWLHRHTGASSEHILQSSHTAIVNAAEVTNKREQCLMDVLTPAQKAKYAIFMAEKRKKNAQKLASLISSRFVRKENTSKLETGSQRHEAANLYILNHKLASALPQSSTKKELPNKLLARFARRPAFESLATVDDLKGPPQRKSRKGSKDLLSGGGLKRVCSEMSCDNLDDERDYMRKSASSSSLCGTSTLTPEAAQSACSTFVIQALGDITNIIPSHRLTRQQPAGQLHHIQPAPVVSHAHPVSIEPSRPRSPILSSLLPANYSNELGFYGGVPQQQPMVPVPVQSNMIHQTVQDTAITNAEQTERIQEQYTPMQTSVPIPQPTPVPAVQNITHAIPTLIDPNHSHQPMIQNVASAPLLTSLRKVPSPLNCARETKEGMTDDMEGIVPIDDVGFWNVSDQMADDSLFDLTEEDWAIGEGAFIE
jgi:hypothetical protein